MRQIYPVDLSLCTNNVYVITAFGNAYRGNFDRAAARLMKPVATSPTGKGSTICIPYPIWKMHFIHIVCARLDCYCNKLRDYCNVLFSSSSSKC